MFADFAAAATIGATVSAFIAKEDPLSLGAATQPGRELWAMNAEATRWLYDLDSYDPNTGSDENREEHLAIAVGQSLIGRRLSPQPPVIGHRSYPSKIQQSRINLSTSAMTRSSSIIMHLTSNVHIIMLALLLW